jgi:hypothetical protein
MNDNTEKEIIDSIESGEWKSVKVLSVEAFFQVLAKINETT